MELEIEVECPEMKYRIKNPEKIKLILINGLLFLSHFRRYVYSLKMFRLRVMSPFPPLPATSALGKLMMRLSFDLKLICSTLDHDNSTYCKYENTLSSVFEVKADACLHNFKEVCLFLKIQIKLSYDAAYFSGQWEWRSALLF